MYFRNFLVLFAFCVLVSNAFEEHQEENEADVAELGGRPRPRPHPHPRCRHQYVPNHKNCSKFSECSNGVLYPLDCPKGLCFDTKKNVCVWRNQKNHCICPSHDNSCKQQYVPNHKNCNKFYECSNGVLFSLDCPKGLCFDTKKNVCVWRNQKNNCTCPSHDNGCKQQYVPNHKNCNKFYECSNGVLFSLDCPKGLCFDTKKNVCVWRNQKNNCICHSQDNRCKQQYVPNHKNCSKFFECSNGILYPLDCPKGLCFDTKKNVCVWRNQKNRCYCHSKSPKVDEDNFVQNDSE